MKLAFTVKRSALLCALALAAPTYAMAEDTVIVTDTLTETSTSPTQGYSATVSRGATKTDEPLITTGQSVSVVTRQQIDDQGALSVNSALNYTPGAFTGFAGGATRYDTVALRGFHGGDVNNTFLDGLRLMSDGGSYNVVQVDPWFLERIDVIKGPSSALYGQTIPGGLVMETSKRPQFIEEGHVRAMYGNNNTNGTAFDYTNAINDEWAWRLIGMTKNTDTQYEKTREERYAISPSVLWQPSENTSLLLRAYLEKDPSGGFHGSVPSDGSIYSSTGRKLDTGFSDVEPGNDEFKRHQQIYSYEFAHSFNDVWAFRSNASYTHSNVGLKQAYQIGWADAAHDELMRYYSGETSSLDAYAIDNQLEADFATGDLDHKVVLGGEFHKYTNNLSDDSAYTTNLNPWTGESGGPGGFYYYDPRDPTYSTINQGLLTKAGKRQYEQTGVYLQDDMKWNQWHMTLSGRYDHMVTKSHIVAEAIDSDVTDNRTDDHFSGRASLLYAFNNGVSPYVSYSQAITPQVLPDADGKLLKPTTAEQYEAGVKYQPVGTVDMYTVALYDLTQKDVGNRVVQGSYFEPAGKVHSQGVELEARSQWNQRFSTIAGYTYNKVRFKDAIDGNDGNTPYVTPDQMASLWGMFKADLGISLGAGVRYIGKQWADNENTLRVPSVTLLDAMVRADMGAWTPSLKGAFVQVNATNLTGRDYVAGCYGTGYCYWGAERSVIATVGYDF
ncbi:TonB-dependent siderophore receptor [Buttiauxella noackiae]|uniref:TonB-dependent siderophore receptor n=1 Tax=Buttiauxella noackiae TaxID=82992 RepID=UPI00235567EA|nr:TonB-dependent siderophore receptor [Buttiauxella noackiae]MCA1920732.1 TonB-dependent siderophore receptor [Buttiauxella noackiae]